MTLSYHFAFVFYLDLSVELVANILSILSHLTINIPFRLKHRAGNKRTEHLTHIKKMLHNPIFPTSTIKLHMSRNQYNSLLERDLPTPDPQTLMK